MSDKVQAFGGKALVVLELGLPIESGLLERGAEALAALGEIDPKMTAAVQEVLAELDPAVADRTIYLGNVSKREIQIVRIERISVNPFWMQIDVSVLMYPNATATEPKEFVFRSIRWNRGVENGVAVLPITAGRHIVLVREFKHAVRRWSVHIPRGVKLDGEDARACGLREAGEEGGVSVSPDSEVFDGGSFEPDTGVLSSRPRLMVVTNVVTDETKVSRDPTEAIAGTVELTWDELCQMIRNGEIIDSFTISALFRAFLEGYVG